VVKSLFKFDEVYVKLMVDLIHKEEMDKIHSHIKEYLDRDYNQGEAIKWMGIWVYKERELNEK
jgi:hypothetical protein